MFKKQYFSILFWKSLVYVMGVFSLLIITPHLTSKPKVFGIYAFCSSIIIFFSYADLGFITAARKFAAEYIAKKQLKQEIAVTAFSGLIFLLFSVPISLIILYFSFHPEILIKDLVNNQEKDIASSLLLILSCSFPILILQRVVQVIYSVRLADYYVFRLEIFSILFKIGSIYYFFNHGRYQIVEYFLFCNILNLINLLILCFFASKKFDYDFLFFAKSLRYRKSVYDKVSRLAFNSLFVSLAWLLFYEIDLLIVTSLAGALAGAQYAIAYNVANILRNLLGTIYYPFTVKFNHLYINNKEQLKTTFYTILKLGSYLFIPGLTILAVFSKPLILSWVGPNFFSSVIILQLLVASYLFYPLNTPIAAIITTKLNIRVLYINSIIMVVIQYFGLWIFHKSGNTGMLLSALKVLCVGISTLILLKVSLSYLKVSIRVFISRVLFLPIALSLLFAIVGFTIIGNYNFYKGLGSLFTTAFIAMLCYTLMIGLLFILDRSFRVDLLKIVKG
ncbi:MAG: hypothetical protein ACOH2A_06775 [Sphingobacteriaceae bacterium]